MLWDTKSGALIGNPLKFHSKGITSLCFSPDNTKIVTGSFDKLAIIWDSKSGEKIIEIKGHSERITSVSFSPDGTRIVTASVDRLAMIWDAKSGI